MKNKCLLNAEDVFLILGGAAVVDRALVSVIIRMVAGHLHCVNGCLP